MARRQEGPRQTTKKRIVLSSLLLTVLFIILLIVAMEYGILGFSGRVQNNQAQFLSDAVRRSAVQCYALEGRYPDSVEYLEENYGLIVDRNRYAVYYESMGANILPQIRVVVISK
ncbi:MAG: hypothetical protein FWD43_01510 [Coriobacteriia bacterium]|nr:hypothetical protein [Coriobacteriia bacterium]